jgi:hypothetical protein
MLRREQTGHRRDAARPASRGPGMNDPGKAELDLDCLARADLL